jgi:glutaminyl-peptide cyclotransferase
MRAPVLMRIPKALLLFLVLSASLACKSTPVPASSAAHTTSSAPAAVIVAPVSVAPTSAPEPVPQVAKGPLPPTPHVSGMAAFALTKEFLAVAPKRFNGSPGHAAAEKFIASHFAPEEKDHRLEVDTFTASTPVGMQTMHNIVVRFPGKKDGIIVLDSHYETNYPLRDINFFGANDGACTSAMLIQIGQYLRSHPPQGYSVWLVFDDGEEAVKEWSAQDSLYGTRHLAAKWSQDGTLGKIKAFLLADMIGDKDLNINPDDQSTPWLVDLLRTAAKNTHHTQNILQHAQMEIGDAHLPFVKRGVPSLDLIDIDYGPKTNELPDGWHHTAQDTIDKISPQSLQVSLDIMMELIDLIDQR